MIKPIICPIVEVEVHHCKATAQTEVLPVQGAVKVHTFPPDVPLSAGGLKGFREQRAGGQAIQIAMVIDGEFLWVRHGLVN